jgi:hypothetical protein
MAFPTLGLDFSPTTDPFDTPSWSSIVGRAHTISISTGRSNELEPFQPGKVQVRLDNHDRLFDPLYSSGTYYPDLKPNKRIRVRATHAAVTYDLFTGFIDGWPQDYMPPSSAYCNLSATDGMKLLARSINLDPYGAIISADSPRVWLRFSETAGSTYSDHSGNDYHASAPTTAPCADNAVDSLTTSDDNAMRFAPGQKIVLPPGAALPSGTEGGMEMWLRVPADSIVVGPPSLQPPYIANGSSGSPALFVDDGPITGERGRLLAYIGAAPLYAVDSFLINDGQVHHILLYRSGADVWLLIDGRNMLDEDASSAPFVNFAGGTFSLNLPVPVAGVNSMWDNPPTIDEFALYDSLADPEATAIAHVEAGRRPYLGDLPGVRVGRILDLAGWPASERDIDAGVTMLGAAKWDASTPALKLLDEVERSELGGCYIDHANAGVFKFRDRTALLVDTRSNTSQATISDDPAETLHYSQIDGSFDEVTTVNKVTVNWVGGAVVSSDASSITENGENGISLDTILPTYEAAKYLADGLLLRYGQPLPKFASITLEPSAQQNLFTEVLSRRIGDRITVERTPQNTGSQIAFDCIVEGIDYVIDNGVNRWTTTYHLSRADPASYWVLDTSALESTATLAF